MFITLIDFKYMNMSTYQYLTLKQKGNNAVKIFPPPPLQQYMDPMALIDVTQFGFEQDENSFTYRKKK